MILIKAKIKVPLMSQSHTEQSTLRWWKSPKPHTCPHPPLNGIKNSNLLCTSGPERGYVSLKNNRSQVVHAKIKSIYFSNKKPYQIIIIINNCFHHLWTNKFVFLKSYISIQSYFCHIKAKVTMQHNCLSYL